VALSRFPRAEFVCSPFLNRFEWQAHPSQFETPTFPSAIRIASANSNRQPFIFEYTHLFTFSNFYVRLRRPSKNPLPVLTRKMAANVRSSDAVLGAPISRLAAFGIVALKRKVIPKTGRRVRWHTAKANSRRMSTYETCIDNSFRMRTYKIAFCKPFRMNTYRTGGEGWADYCYVSRSRRFRGASAAKGARSVLRLRQIPERRQRLVRGS
jgi:hypothetical protein